MDIRFKDIEKTSESALSYQFSISDNGLGRLTFRGVYGYGSKGNPDGELMLLVTQEALLTKTTKKLIVDLTDLKYEWGNTVDNMIGKLYHAQIPVAIIYGEKCKAIVPLDNSLFVRTEIDALAKIE